MLTTAQKYNMHLAAIRLDPDLRKKLPTWHLLQSQHHPLTTNAARCLLNVHKIETIEDLLNTSARVRNMHRNEIHENTPQCMCEDCVLDRIKGCENPH